MNETIVVEMADILQRTCLYQGLSVLIGILGIGLWYFRKKLFFPIVMIFIMFYGYFSANDYYRDRRDERILQKIQAAGIPAEELMYIYSAKDEIELMYYNKEKDEHYLFRVRGEYWHTDRVILEKL